MRLSWSDPDHIAKALLQAYPDEDRLALTLEGLKEKIRALSGFDDAPDPPKPAHLEHILWRWMRIADGEAT